VSGKNDKSLARNLGEFFGHIWSGVKADPQKPAARKQTLRRDVEERSQPAPGGKVTVRRTTIEEVEYEADEGGSADRGGDQRSG
jgi:hypothetical protein